MRTVSLLLLAGAMGCNPPSTILVCHNANCAEPADPEHDDTLGAMAESLALTVDNRPAIDGLEMDSLYRGTDGACLFAHDFDNAELADARDPAHLLALHFAEPGPITYSAPRFRVELELKPEVSSNIDDKHTPEQAAAHAACIWDVYDIIAEAAVANQRDVEVVIESFAPELIQAVIDATPTDLPLPVSYAGEQGIPKPLDGATEPLDVYRGLPLSEIEFHNQWITDAQYEAVQTHGWDVAFFMFSATTETFAQIDRYHPVMVTTSEARLLRRWLER